MSTKPISKRTIPIMGARYRIEYHSTIKTDDKEDLYGDTDKNRKRIRVDLGHTKTERTIRDTLLHECLHAILAQSGIDNLLTGDAEEAIVTALEHGLAPLVEFKPSIWKRVKPATKLELEMDEDDE